MLARWGELSYNTLDFARSISLLYAFILIAICFEVLTILSMSLRHRHFDVYTLSYVSMTALFLILINDTSSSIALGILGLLLVIFYLAWPALCRAGRDMSSRPYLMTLGGLMIPLILLIGFRLFSSTTVSAFVTQKALGINLMTQIILIIFWGSAVGTLLFSWQNRRPLGKRRINWACLTAAAAAIVHVVLIGGILLFRYWTMRTSTYDFGLFAQMFTYMKETGLPQTTLERNGLLSHFAVHLSPIFYLMLPFYLIWPNPVTLQILQPVIVISGLIPLMLLARHFKVPVGWQAITAVIYAFHPGLLGSSLYDLHENCFLAPLLLWVLYFLEKKNWLGGLISAALVLAVKEDAALYLLAIAIYAIVSRKNWKFGLVLASFSAAYFAFALILLARIGSGPMIGRFDNLIADPNLGLLSVPLTLMRNPGYLLSQVFTEEKLIYIVKMMLPVGFLPILNRRINSWILLVPFLVMT